MYYFSAANVMALNKMVARCARSICVMITITWHFGPFSTKDIFYAINNKNQFKHTISERALVKKFNFANKFFSTPFVY